MATVTGYTADRMRQIEDASVVDGTVVGNDLILTRYDGTTIDAGNVRGNPGAAGPAGGAINDVTVDSLPSTGIVSAHRCGAGSGAATAITPEGSLLAGWYALAAGAHILDIDYRRTADGALVAMHDDTVDRTTVGTGTVANHYATNLPPIDPSETAGAGWGTSLQVPTILQFLATYGGKAIMTIEAKGGIADVKPLADILKARGLANSVFINTSDVAVIAEIVAQGILAHLWAWDDTSKVGPGITAGASLIEVPYNATADIVTQCQNARNDSSKKLRWFIAGPISTRSNYTSMTSGIMGHVTDALGYTNRSSGAAPQTTSIKPSLMAGKRGIGWKTSLTTSADPTGLINLQPNKGLAWNALTGANVSSSAGIYLGDISGTMPSSYTMAMKFVPDDSFVGATPNVRFRVASTIGGAMGTDTDSNGYVVIINGTGRMRLYSAAPVLGAAGILLYEDATATPFTSGSEYTVSLTISSTTVRLTMTGTGINKTSGNVGNTDWRGEHMYIWRVSTVNPGVFITDFART